MLTLTNGPAAGEYDCNTAPPHLRAVINPEGGKFCLDGPEDRPQENEELHIYRRRGRPFTANICGRGRSGTVVMVAEYSLVDGLDGEQLRDLAAWRLWCIQQEEGK